MHRLLSGAVLLGMKGFDTVRFVLLYFLFHRQQKSLDFIRGSIYYLSIVIDRM